MPHQSRTATVPASASGAPLADELLAALLSLGAVGPRKVPAARVIGALDSRRRVTSGALAALADDNDDLVDRDESSYSLTDAGLVAARKRPHVPSWAV